MTSTAASGGGNPPATATTSPSYTADQRAADFAAMVVTMSEWVNRRVDAIEFADGASLVYRTSIDFTLPRWSARGEAENSWLVPVDFLAKEYLTSLDVVDSSGSSLPVLTRRQNGDLGVAALHAAACSQLLAADPSADVGAVDVIARLIGDIVYGDGPDAQRTLDVLRSLVGVHATSGGPLAALGDNAWFSDMCGLFVESFALVVEITCAANSRGIIKVRYVTQIPQSGDPRTKLERLTDKLGWTTDAFCFDLPGAARASSFHFEVTAPDGLTVTEGHIQNEPAGIRKSFATDKAGRRVLHMMVPQAGLSEYQARFNMRIARVGWLRTCLTAAWAMTLLMLLCAWRVPHLVESSIEEGSRVSVDVAAMLVTLAAFLAAFIVRTGEHGLTSRRLTFVRPIVLVSVAAPFGAAWLLAFGPDDVGTLQFMWSLLTGVNWIAMVALQLTHHGPDLLTKPEPPVR